MANGAHNKAILEPLLRAMQDFEAPQVQSLLQELMAHDAVAHMCLPFNDVTGPTALYETCYQPLLRAMPDLERRDFIMMSSPSSEGQEWVSKHTEDCCCNFLSNIFLESGVCTC